MQEKGNSIEFRGTFYCFGGRVGISWICSFVGDEQETTGNWWWYLIPPLPQACFFTFWYLKVIQCHDFNTWTVISLFFHSDFLKIVPKFFTYTNKQTIRSVSQKNERYGTQVPPHLHLGSSILQGTKITFPYGSSVMLLQGVWDPKH